MKYYLPITINERRLHICHLEEHTTNNIPKPTFSFIINNEGNNLQVFSVNTDDADLISTDGYDCDVNLSKLKTNIEYSENSIDSLPTYYVNLWKGKKLDKSKNDGLVSNGSFSNSDKYFHIDIDKTVMSTETNSFVVVIRYKTDNKEYSYAFKIHLCAKDNLIEAAIDFGSEASQIFVKSDGTNLKLVNEFRKFHSQHSEIDDFWQGALKDNFYKSIFFLHKTPDKTEYAEVPNKNLNKTHLQTLLPKVADPTIYNDLEILPNMKLIELVDLSNQQTFDIDITFEEGSPYDSTKSANLANKTTREGILRLILSNFLYCILENKLILNYDGKKRCLRLVLLMPNVYYQQKVYAIIKNLYEDFIKITANSKYLQYGGLEVQIISESDAAFVGTKKDQSVPKIDATNGYFLIIDAGKGTTDFSILKQYNNFSKFDSIYRAGIPASGHLLTYAFYEAIRNFLNSKHITLNDKLKAADRATLLNFMNCAEKFKINFEKSEDKEISFDLQADANLGEIITFLNKLLENLIRIPKSEEKVDIKINELVEKLKEAIDYGVKSSSDFKQFEQVLLTGRGFLFEKFKNAVKAMLKKENWIANENLIFSYSSDRAKSICLTGAFSTTEEIEINKNSELIGRPIIQRRIDVKDSWFSRNTKIIIDKLRKVANKSDENLDTEFFYHGQSTTLLNPLVRVGGRETTPNLQNTEEKRLYFIGDGFIFQTKNSIIPFNEEYLNSELSPLVIQTLFPFFKGSIPEKELITTPATTTVLPESPGEEQEEVAPEIIDTNNIDA